VYLVIAGEGPQSENLSQQIIQDGLEDRVLLVGGLPTKQVKQLLQATDIFVHPSRHNEGFPNVILEAGSCGNYVIATDVAGVREVIHNKKTGALIDSDDDKIYRSLLWAVSNINKRKMMGKNLRTLLQHGFDWSSIVTKYYRLLSMAQQSDSHKPRSTSQHT